jgi:fructosamine-3-kinase
VSAFRRRVAQLTGVAEDRLERLSGGDLSEVLLVPRADGRVSVAKGGAAAAAEAAMLRGLAGAGIPAPAVEAEHEGVLLLEFVPNDRVFTANAWAQIGGALRRLHADRGDRYGWPVDYRIGTVDLSNRGRDDWPGFWGEQRLLSTASLLDRPWRERIDRLVPRLPSLLPQKPAAAHLHGDFWTGNVLVRDGGLAALIDPACYHGDAEVDLAMLTLFDTPPPQFWEAYGALEPDWQERRPLYQLFPALLHLRLFGAGYAGMVDRLLRAAGA